MSQSNAVTEIAGRVASALRADPSARAIAIDDADAVLHLAALGEALAPLGVAPREVRIGARGEQVLALRDEIEAALAGRFPTAIGLRIDDLWNLSAAELGREGSGMSAALLERLVALLRGFAERFAGRFRVILPPGFALFSARSTLQDLRINADALRRLGIDWEPAMVSFRGEGAPSFEDDRVAEVWEALRAAAERAAAGEAVNLIRVFEAAMDEAAGEARGKKQRPLRMVQAPRDRGGPRASTAQVVLNKSCNQACAFCNARGAEQHPPRMRAARAIMAVREAAKNPLRQLVITGAEPTLEWYLDELVRLAKNLGVPEVVLETNATLLGEGRRAAELAEAGLGRAVVALNALDPAQSDATTRDPGGHARTVAGVRALLAAGIPVELAVALVPQNRGALADLVARADRVFSSSGARVEAVIARVLPGALGVREAAAELTAAARASEASGLPLRAAPGGDLPPCVFDDPPAAAAVYRLGAPIVAKAADRHQRVRACEACAAQGVCPGPRREVAAAVAAVARPLDASIAGRLAPPSETRARVLSEYRSRFFVGGHAGARERRIVRVNFHCNQACDFCFVSRELPQVEDELIEKEIREAAAASAILDLSGGEPTLNPKLPEYIALARRLGVTELELQTNAIKMADPEYARVLVEAGLDQTFVSLHGITAAVSDRVTAAPGTFDKTVAGIKNLLANKVSVKVNFVLCGYNVEELPALPDFVHREFIEPYPDVWVGINFSYVAASTDNVPRDTQLIPRFSDVAWALAAAHRRALSLGIVISGFDAKCGVPPCYLPDDLRELHFVTEIPAEERANAAAAGFTKAEACARCELDKRCYGIRTSYAEMHGTSELLPIQNGQAVGVAPPRTTAAYAGRTDPVWSEIGLAPSHKLREGSARALGDGAAFARLPSTWADRVGSRLDLELIGLDAGLRSVVKRERPNVEEAERTADLFTSHGYVVRVCRGPGARATAFIARDAAAAEEAVAVELSLRGSVADQVAAVKRMGAMLGYPACCVDAFSAAARQDDETHMGRLSRAQSGPLLPEQNWAAIGLRPFSHFPCTPGCDATARLGRATLDAVAARDPHAGEMLGRALASVVVLMSAERLALLVGARADGPDAFRYEEVLSHKNLGIQDALLQKRSFRAFYLEVVAPLEEGNRLVRTATAFRIERDGQPIAKIDLEPPAPRLLDFTGARAVRRLPVAPQESAR
jgi:MoaA/NifB/PqqE/SkfB family radical SAM enzyme